MNAAPQKQDAVIYHFTKCRTCIESRKALKDATFECVWCLAHKSNNKRQPDENKTIWFYVVVAAITCLLVADGYLVIEHCGVMTKYTPTDKWKQTMMKVEGQTTFVHSKDGCRALPPVGVKGLLPAYSGSEPTTYIEETP